MAKDSELPNEVMTGERMDLIRAAVMNATIPDETAQLLARLLYVTASLSDGPASARVELHFHDGSDFKKLYGGSRLLCLRVTTDFGRACIAYPAQMPCAAP